MADFSSMYGSHFIPNRVWRPKIEVTQENVGLVPPEEFTLDPYLPGLGIDPFDPSGVIVIPRGRLVGVGFEGGQGGSTYRAAYTLTGKTPITLCEGKEIAPAGMAINQMYKRANDFMTDDNTVKYKSGFIAEVPFVLSVNNAHGTLRAGDRVTGYWGSTTSTTPASNLHRGKPVKWNAKNLYAATASASNTHVLSSAVYPGITPTVVAVWAGASLLTTATATLSFNGSAWQVGFTGTGSGTVTTVLYTYGQDADMIAGEVVRIQSLSDMLTRDDFLKWVEYAPNDTLNFPPAATRQPVTAVSNETPSTVVSGSQYRVTYYPISVHHAVTVDIKATITDMNGVETVHSDWYTLPTSVTDARGFFIGNYHSVNWRTGLIELASNISTVTAIRVSYSYITNERDGAALWGGGIINMTDGRNTSGLAGNGVGIPTHLNLSDVVAGMRLYVR